MVSKAAEWSSRQRQVTCWRPLVLIRWSRMERSRVSFEWNFRYADWSGLRSWFRTRWSVKRNCTTRPTILDMVEIGDWSSVRKIFFVHRGFLEKGSDDRLFQQRGKVTRSKTQIDYASDDGARTHEQWLRSDVWRASRPHCMLGRSRIDLSISSSVAGGGMLKTGSGTRGGG